MATETIEVTGHIVDSLLLAKILDTILEAGCDYEMVDVVIGKTSLDPSSARIAVTGDDDVLGPLLDELQVHGANRLGHEDATLVDADTDGVLPAGFYSTTNLAGAVRVDGSWLPIENPEMDCGLVVRDGHAETVPMHRIRIGDRVVVGSEGVPTEGGHANHLRVINEIRRHGSIAAAVGSGFVTGGVMRACVVNDVPFVLGGSIRDDGPLPDVITDVAAAADAMRARLPGVQVALMLASTLHAIATGNILPGGVETFCVDINQAVVTKLADRGSHQALGVVTDVGPFLHDLARELTGSAT